MKEKEPEFTQITREDFILKCQDALEVFSGQIDVYRQAVDRINFLVQKSTVFEDDPNIRVSYLMDEQGQVQIETHEKKFGFLKGGGKK